jgi:hypothetical protein
VNGIEIVALTEQTTTTARSATAEEEFETTDETTAVASVQASPNPFTDRLNLTLTAQSENVSIALQDMNGYTVLEDVQHDVSEINLDFGTTRLPAGIYILTVNADGKVAKQRVIKR